MKVVGLPGQVIRNGRAGSRLFGAKTPDIEAARRRDAVARWRRGVAEGLTAAQAAQAVGVGRATLYRWEKQPEPRSRRPKHVRGRRWPAGLVEAVEALRNDNPVWGNPGFNPGSDRSCALPGTPSPMPLSGAFSPIWSGLGVSSRRPGLSDLAGRQRRAGADGPGGSGARSRPSAPVRRCSSTRSRSASAPAKASSSSPPWTALRAGPWP